MERNISCIKLWSWGAALPPEKNVLGHLRAQVREECILLGGSCFHPSGLTVATALGRARSSRCFLSIAS